MTTLRRSPSGKLVDVESADPPEYAFSLSDSTAELVTTIEVEESSVLFLTVFCSICDNTADYYAKKSVTQYRRFGSGGVTQIGNDDGPPATDDITTAFPSNPLTGLVLLPTSSGVELSAGGTDATSVNGFIIVFADAHNLESP